MSDLPSSPEIDRTEASDLLRRINDAWLEGRPRDLQPLFHPHIVMIYPGFTGRSEGRDPLIDGFIDFCTNAQVLAFEQRDHQIDVMGSTAIASFAFTMVYEREASRYRSTGRDLWVFVKERGEWVAAWRTMLNVTDDPE